MYGEWDGRCKNVAVRPADRIASQFVARTSSIAQYLSGVQGSDTVTRSREIDRQAEIVGRRALAQGRL
ncbi:hypothetical protein GCM10028856_00920 [Halopiger thermotolerans]